VALGGTSYAAFSLPKNSVGTNQLRKSSVTTTRIKNGSITEAKLNKRLNVPHATHAGDAARAFFASTADQATSAKWATTATHAITADSASAVAYAHVLATGALDAEHSKNISVTSRASLGVYCLKVTTRVANATATNDFGATGKFGTASAVLSGQDPSSFITTNCPAGDNVLVGTADAQTGTAADRGFWVTFN
jgi:hypothetical protein